ncbi:MAG: DUF4019 domain-containing protein [Woeseiaceae bacterium]
MTIRSSALIPVLLMVSACATESVTQADDPVAAAETFLHAVDGGRLRETWSGCSEVMRERVAPEDWANHLASSREPLGTLNHREFFTIEYQDSLEDVPDGRYALLSFHSSFENKDGVEEVVALALEDDSTWRIIGYFVH